MRIKINRNVKQDKDGYWWIISRSGKPVRKISYHAIIKDSDGLWHIKKRNGALTEKGWHSLQEAFDYSDNNDRMIAFGCFILMIVVIAIIVNVFAK